MKNSKIKILALLVSLSLLTFNCLNEDDKPIQTINADSYSSLNELVQSIKPNTQTFSIDPTVTQTFTGEDGTIFTINPNTFTDINNNTITTPITVKLQEYLTLEDMILGNVQTISNGQLLITGGSFNLTFEDINGNTVNANASNIQSQIPVQTDITSYENSMQYYIGDSSIVDGREMVNWELNQNSDSWFQAGVFNIFGLEQGLANCDVLYDLTGDTPTQFEVSIPGITDFSTTTIWMVIEDFPSVIMLTSLNTNMTALKSYDNSIPTGLNATLIAVTVDSDRYLKFGSLPITVAGDDAFSVTVDYGTTEELTTLIQAIAN